MQRRKGKIYHLNAEFQRIAKKDKKGFSCEKCKEIEGKIDSLGSPTKMGP